MARAIDRCDLMIKVLRVPGVQGNRLQDLQPNRSCETTHNMVFHLCYRVTFIRSKIFFKWIRTHYSPFSGEVCAGSDCRRNVRFAHLYPPYRVSGVTRILGSLVINPNPTPRTQQPRAHQALGVGDELPDRNLLVTLQLDDGGSPLDHLGCNGKLQIRCNLCCARNLRACPWPHQ